MSRKDVEAVFDRLCVSLGKRQATSYNDVGGWMLDHNGVHGGYVVVEIMSESGGQTHPLGDERRPARAFCESVWFALRVLEAAQTRV